VNTYTLFHQANPGTVTSAAGNSGTNGLHFTVSSTGVLQGTWHYSPSPSTQLPTTIALYTTQASPATGTLVTSNTPTWSGAAGSGWVYAPFTTPQVVSPGTQYMLAHFRNDAVNEWFVFYTTTWPVTSGIITAPDDVSTGQGWFNSPGTTLTFPATQTAGNNWGIDVQITTSIPGTQGNIRSRGITKRTRTSSSKGTPVTLPATPSPFKPPVKSIKGKASAGKSRASGSKGSPVNTTVTLSPFAPPKKPVKGDASAKKSRTSSSAGTPVNVLVNAPGFLVSEAGTPLLTEAATLFDTEFPPASVFNPPANNHSKPNARKAKSPSSKGSPPFVVTSPSPFHAPNAAVKGKASAKKAKTASSSGVPVSVPPQGTPSVFTPPVKAVKGKTANVKSRQSSSAGTPVTVPSPFTPPEKANRGQPDAKRSRTSSAKGSPFVPTLPSVFHIPGKAVKGDAAIARSRRPSSKGSPPNFVPSPFAAPVKAVKGKPAVRKGRHSRSPVPVPNPSVGNSLFNQVYQTGLTLNTNTGTVGLVFSSSINGFISGLWIESYPGDNHLPSAIALYNEATTTLISSNTSPIWSGAPGSGWIYAAFNSPVAITASTLYTAAIFGTANFSASTASYGWPFTNSPLTAQTQQGWYNIGGSLAYPSSQLSGQNWWIDVSFQPGNLHVPLNTAQVIVTANQPGVAPSIPLNAASVTVTAHSPGFSFGADLGTAVVTETAYPLVPFFPGGSNLLTASSTVTAYPVTELPVTYVHLAVAQQHVTAYPVNAIPPTPIPTAAATQIITAHRLFPPNPLLMSMTPNSGTDEFGNAYEAGFHLYNTSSRLSLSNSGPFGSNPNIQYLPGSTSNVTTQPTTFGWSNNAAAANQQTWLIHSSGKTNGQDDAAIQLTGAAGDASSSATMTFEFGGSVATVLKKTGGFSNPSWTSATLINGWSASGGGVNGIFYRYNVNGEIEVMGDIIHTSATGNSVAATLPITGPYNMNHQGAWNNVAASNSASAPWIFTDTSGNIQITGISVANHEVFFHIFIPTN
jgi:Domain of unknown function (DUF4082)